MAKKPKSKPPEEKLTEEIEQVADDEVVEDVVEEADEADAADATEADIEAVADADAEVETVDEVEDVEAEGVEDVEAVEGEEEAVAVVEDGDGGGDEEPPASVDEGPKRPRPRLTKTSIALVLLNWIMAPAFLIVAAMDYKVRLDYAYRAIINYTKIVGLPLKEEEDFPSLSIQTRPHLLLSKDQLKKAAQSRNAKPGGDYQAVEETLPIHLRPSDMTDELLADIFIGLSNPVPTIEDEMDRLKNDLPKRIADAGDEVLKTAKDDDSKRAIIHKTLFPIVGATHLKDKATPETPLNLWEVDRLNEKLQKASGAELDAWVKDSVQRRIYYDILAPFDIYRPGDVEKLQIERLGDQSVTIDEIKGYLVGRLLGSVADSYDPKTHIGPKYFGAGVKRDSVEKRHQVAFLLFTLGQVEKPIVNKKLIDKGIDRAQTVSGLYEFTNAAIHYVRAIRVLEERLVQAIRDDRNGSTYKPEKGPISRNEGFIDQYEAEVNRLVILAAYIESAQKRLADLGNRKNEFTKIHDQRAKHYAEMLAKLQSERTSTAKYVADLRALHKELHGALKELSDAAATNLRLVREIEALETSVGTRFVPKGGKK